KAGWQHGATVGTDDWGIISFAGANTGSYAWFKNNPTTTSDTWLQVPAVNLEGKSQLSFWHTFEFEEGGYDGGVLEISTDGGTTWQDLESRIIQNGYNGVISDFGGNPLGVRPAWVSGTIGSMMQVLVDLTDFAGTNRLVRFRFASDSSFGGEGWYIDDIIVSSYHQCAEGTPTNTPTTTPTDMPITETPTLTPIDTPTDTPVSETPTDTPTWALSLYDLNSDGAVDAEDLLLVIDLFGTINIQADFNNDGIVDERDLFLFSTHWKENP
ncbi:MAG TPA: GC-type dockerin domain-anchored protein, partial [bacterium]|nr:GC-type dockerin domain-anchored protein [bacterium]